MRSTEIGGEWFSVVGLGGYEFEDDPDWPGAREVLLAAIEGGIDWIDTAEEYCDRKNEPVIAAALARCRSIDEALQQGRAAPRRHRATSRSSYAKRARAASSDSVSTASTCS